MNQHISFIKDIRGDTGYIKYFVAHTMALIPPEATNSALASLDCRTAPSKSEGKQLKDISHIK